jgi:hypothetical protein
VRRHGIFCRAVFKYDNYQQRRFGRWRDSTAAASSYSSRATASAPEFQSVNRNVEVQ